MVNGYGLSVRMTEAILSARYALYELLVAEEAPAVFRYQVGPAKSDWTA